MSIDYSSQDFRQGLELGLSCGAIAGASATSQVVGINARNGALCKVETFAWTETKVIHYKDYNGGYITYDEAAEMLLELGQATHLPCVARMYEKSYTATHTERTYEVDITLSARYIVRLRLKTIYATSVGGPSIMYSGNIRFDYIPVIDGVEPSIFNSYYLYYGYDTSYVNRYWYCSVWTYPETSGFSCFCFGASVNPRWAHINDEVFLGQSAYRKYDNPTKTLTISNISTLINTTTPPKFLAVDIKNVASEERVPYSLYMSSITTEGIDTELNTLGLSQIRIPSELIKVTNLVDTNDYAYVWVLGTNGSGLYFNIDYLGGA